jgi:uncharacterized protein (TIRG00374 family)
MRRSWQLIAAQIAFGAALVIVLLFTVDLSDVKRVFEEAEYVWVLAAMPLFVVANVIGAVRSRLTMHRMGDVPVMPLFETYLVAFMVNSLVPLRIGDVLRIQVISRRYGLPAGGVTSAVFITETLLDGAAFTLLFLWTLAVFGVPSVLVSLAWTLSAIILAGVIVGSVFARLELEDGWVDRSIVRHFPGRLRGPVGRLLPEFLQGLSLLADWRMAAKGFALTLIGWMVQAALYWSFGRAFGLDLSLADAILVMMTASFIVSAHFIPTSIGVYEGSLTGLLVVLGMSGGEALAYAAGTHILMIVFGLICGITGMWRLRLTVGDLVAIGRQQVEGKDAEGAAEAPDTRPAAPLSQDSGALR